VSVCKQGTASGQRINVGRVRQWMPVEATDPVILIINGDE
jgi:hypothetical protein